MNMYIYLYILQMVQSREHQVSQSENETKLDQVQSRFPNDTLYLSETLESMEVRVLLYVQ